MEPTIRPIAKAGLFVGIGAGACGRSATYESLGQHLGKALREMGLYCFASLA